ncbi:MAG: tetratricopeptide repeat protein [Fimbriimonadales bacterium]
MTITRKEVQASAPVPVTYGTPFAWKVLRLCRRYNVIGFVLLMGVVMEYPVRAYTQNKQSFLRPSVVQYPPPEIEIPATLTELESLAKQHPADFSVHSDLMVLYAQKGQWERCIEAGFKAMQVDPSDVNVHLGIIYAYANLNQFDQALNQVELSLKRPFQGWERSALLRVKGDLLMDFYRGTNKRTFLTESRTSYRKALEVDAKNALARIGLARVDIERKLFRTAKQHLEKVRSQVKVEQPGGHRKLALALYYLGLIEELQGRYKTAQSLYQQAIRTHPSSFKGVPRGGR